MNGSPAQGYQEILQGLSPDDFQEAITVLQALQIPTRMTRHETWWSLEVAAKDHLRAVTELAEYSREGQAWQETRPSPWPRVSRGFWGAAVYCLVLLLANRLQQLGHFSFDIGALDRDRVRDGEWWRAVTAMTLHTDTIHIVGNLVFGCLFGVMLSNSLGSGVAWFASALGGGLGNWISVWLRQEPGTAVGASSAVFACVGVLAALSWRRYLLHRKGRMRRAAPLIVGLCLLGLLGTGGERTDVLGHVCGLAAGMLVGAVAMSCRDRLLRREEWQSSLGLATLAIVAGCWMVATRGC